MSGSVSNYKSIPRGLLLYHQMGIGKTIEALSTSLYCISTLS
jgi:hypothetical protein